MEGMNFGWKQQSDLAKPRGAISITLIWNSDIRQVPRFKKMDLISPPQLKPRGVHRSVLGCFFSWTDLVGFLMLETEIEPMYFRLCRFRLVHRFWGDKIPKTKFKPKLQTKHTQILLILKKNYKPNTMMKKLKKIPHWNQRRRS